jgi:DNA-binding transcriptional regulator YiaG
MPNISALLKTEFSRIARKEGRGEIAILKKSVSGYRREIAALKRRMQTLEQQLRRVSKAAGKGAAEAEGAAAEGAAAPEARRFSAKGFASQRRRLGVSARECGLLIGVSAQSVYNWEEGKSRPQAQHLAAISALRSLGRKNARLHLERLAAA